MTDRHRYPSSGRAATFANHARTSLPSSIGYTSLYAGDMHVMPTSTRQQPISTTPRGYVTTTSTTPTPSTTTRTPTTRDVTRSQRSSTLDSTSRPPVIVMTTQKDRANGASSHSSNARPGSPLRDDYRSSDGQFYTQPASSIPQPAPMPTSQETTLMLAAAETVATAWYATTPTATVAILLYTRTIPVRALVISTMGMMVISTLMPVNWFATISIIQALRGLADVRVSTVATTAPISTTMLISERSTWIPAQT
ncbi:hypothetical protein LB503_009778 [Fusarium chuoi]|nr:hypothetical protein LB503_009778 [Fusarium chuoi]